MPDKTRIQKLLYLKEHLICDCSKQLAGTYPNQHLPDCIYLELGGSSIPEEKLKQNIAIEIRKLIG